ncbi:hypothetical protein [Nonomuraea sp. GTA35]|uniref:hypothetical protein n=1 Tax=Nonomuraea sp. GTA35 TaxID=1676746 RepID=UPI0035C1BBF6
MSWPASAAAPDPYGKAGEDGLGGLPAYIQGWARRATLITRLQELLGSNTILLTPASAEPPFEHDAGILDAAQAVEDRAPRLSPLETAFTVSPGSPANRRLRHADRDQR